DFIRYNASTQTFEYYVSDFMEEYNLSFDTETQMQLLSFPLSFTTELKGLSNGYHTFTYALTEGATDPATVSNAYEREFLVDYHDYDEGTEEPGDEYEETEELCD